MTRQTTADKIAIRIRESLPSLMRQGDESAKEAIQTTVWLVGLATGLLALLSAKPELLIHLGALRPWLVVGLFGVVVVGVCQRLAQQILSGKERVLAYSLEMYLWGWTEPFEDPLPLQDWWREEQILERLKVDFNLDYSAFRDNNVPLKAYQDAYAGHYKTWEEFEHGKHQRMAQLMMVLQGKKDEVPTNTVADTDPFSSLRPGATTVRRWLRLRNALYYTTCLLFMGIAALVAIALI